MCHPAKILYQLDATPYCCEVHSHMRDGTSRGLSLPELSNYHTLMLDNAGSVLDRYPILSDFLSILTREHRLELRAVFVLTIPPGNRMLLEPDRRMARTANISRFHFVLQSDGIQVFDGNTGYTWERGQLWQLDTGETYRLMNLSRNWSIHLVFYTSEQRVSVIPQCPVVVTVPRMQQSVHC